MRQRLCPLELSGIMTFAVLAILTLTTSLAWKERARLLAENQRLSEWFEPLQLAESDARLLVASNP